MPQRLPSIRVLARTVGVHRNTAAAVYRDLERFGLVRCAQGRGTYATAPRDPYGGSGRPPRMAADLLDPLTTELAELPRATRHPLRGRHRASVGPGALALLALPIDERPPEGEPVIPVAPRGTALRAIASLQPGSNVRLVSRSPSIARLVRHALLALHGDTVGMRRVDYLPPDRYSSGVDWDVTLLDARERRRILEADGTSARRDAFVPLRLLTSGDHSDG